VADILIGAVPNVSYDIANALSGLISLISGSPTLPQNSYAAAQSLSTAGSLAFNARHPEGVPATACGEGAYQVNGVQYFSWSGARSYTNVFDALDPFLAVTSLAFNGEKNDGLVASCSSHLGRVIRDDYALNHADEINQLVGITNLFETDPVTLYRQQANRLQGLGL
jgi:triacylglycerol lipase